MSYEYQVDVGGVMYGMNDLKSVEITSPLFDKYSVGNACSAELDMSFWPTEDPPRMAKIIPYVRETGTEEWYQLGVFYIDTRPQTGTLMQIVAFDAMLKSEVVWEPDDDMEFPMTMERGANIIAGLMGVEMDERCVFNSTYTMDYPDTQYTLRMALQDIAAAHAGNWIMTNEGRLLLIPLGTSAPPETHYLIDETGDYITFGGDRILI